LPTFTTSEEGESLTAEVSSTRPPADSEVVSGLGLETDSRRRVNFKQFLCSLSSTMAQSPKLLDFVKPKHRRLHVEANIMTGLNFIALYLALSTNKIYFFSHKILLKRGFAANPRKTFAMPELANTIRQFLVDTNGNF